MSDLYIVESVRPFNGKPIKHVRFVYKYSTAMTYARELLAKGFEVTCIKHYKFCCDLSIPGIK